MAAKTRPVGHTPGEWHVEPYVNKHEPHKGKVEQVYISAKRIHVAGIVRYGSEPIEENGYEMANARLIALSPEMLAGLESLCEDLENNGEIFGTDQKRIDFIQSIIRKARGE